MYPSLRDHIAGMAGMAGMANPTSEQLERLYAGWDTYFAALNIVGEAEQEEEFHGIMRIRVRGGSISLVAPDVKKELNRERQADAGPAQPGQAKPG